MAVYATRRFKVRPGHPKLPKGVEDLIESIYIFASHTTRNGLIGIGRGQHVWFRPPDKNGRGVEAGNETSDFYRFVAHALGLYKEKDGQGRHEAALYIEVLD